QVPRRFQQPVVAPGAGSGRNPALHQRRSRPRRRRGAGQGDGAPAQVLPAADLAQPALALRRLRTKIHGCAHDHAPCRRVPSRARPGDPGRPGPRPEFTRPPPPRSEERMARSAKGGDCKKESGSMTTYRDDILEQAAEWRTQGKGVAIATVVTTWG